MLVFWLARLHTRAGMIPPFCQWTMNSKMITLCYREVKVRKIAKQKSEKWWIFSTFRWSSKLDYFTKKLLFSAIYRVQKAKKIFWSLGPNHGGACGWHCCIWLTIRSYDMHFVFLGFTYLYWSYKLDCKITESIYIRALLPWEE